MRAAHRIHWRWRIVACAGILFLSACSPAEPVARLVNIEVLESGKVIVLGSDAHPEGESDSRIDWQVESEVCLDQEPLTCVRIELGTGRVDETADGGHSWHGVLDIDDQEPWLAHVVEYSYADPDVEAFDVVLVPGDRVLVAMGRLGIVERGAEGEWSATDADLRHLDSTPALSVVAALGVLVFSFFWHRLKGALIFPDPTRRFFTSSAAGTLSTFAAIPAIVFTTAGMYFEGGFGFLFLAAFFVGMPLAVISLLITVTTTIRCFGADRRLALGTLRDSVLAVGLLALLLLGIAVLWSSALIGWHSGLASSAVVAVASLVLAARPIEIDLPHPVPVAAVAQ